MFSDSSGIMAMEVAALEVAAEVAEAVEAEEVALDMVAVEEAVEAVVAVEAEMAVVAVVVVAVVHQLAIQVEAMDRCLRHSKLHAHQDRQVLNFILDTSQ